MTTADSVELLRRQVEEADNDVVLLGDLAADLTEVVRRHPWALTSAPTAGLLDELISSVPSRAAERAAKARRALWTATTVTDDERPGHDG